MKMCVIYPEACSESAKELAKALGCKAINPNRKVFDPDMWDEVFNYGIGNANCTDKIRTFEILSKAGIPVPKFSINPKEAMKWETVVCRTNGKHGNEGIAYSYSVGRKKLPPADFYTEYFYHQYEYRIVVFKGKVVGRYRKDEIEEGIWNFTLMLKQGFEDIDRSCVKAAGALQIDYVGFDVLEAKDGSYVILEANSGPILTEEAKEAIVKYFNKLK